MIATDLLRSRPRSGTKKTSDTERVSVSTLSKLTGFPLEFIKKELLIQEDTLSMGELRESMLQYLSKSDDRYSVNN